MSLEEAFLKYSTLAIAGLALCVSVLTYWRAGRRWGRVRITIANIENAMEEKEGSSGRFLILSPVVVRTINCLNVGTVDLKLLEIRSSIRVGPGCSSNQPAHERFEQKLIKPGKFESVDCWFDPRGERAREESSHQHELESLSIRIMSPFGLREIEISAEKLNNFDRTFRI